VGSILVRTMTGSHVQDAPLRPLLQLPPETKLPTTYHIGQSHYLAPLQRRIAYETLFSARNAPRLMDKERVLSIFAKDIPGLGKMLWETANSTRAQQIVAIGNQRPPHSNKAAWPSLFPAINHVVARLHLNEYTDLVRAGADSRPYIH